MDKRLVQSRRPGKPLAIRDGLNPTRARVPDDHAGITAWDFLSTLIITQRYRHPEDDEAMLTRRFDAGEVVRSTGEPLLPTSLLSAGEDVWFYRIPAPEVPVPGEILTLYEDENLLVVDKPHFLATMPRARHITETATVRLRRATGNNELSPAHRLDRPTAGVLLLTKHPRVRGAYQELFARREVTKVYEALAQWSPSLAEATPTRWEDRIEKVPGDLQAEFAPGKVNAITTLASVTKLSALQQAALAEVHGPIPPIASYELHPLTGRTHQLRMHMWKAGVPILGDMIYPTTHPAEEEDFAVPLRLIARSISFIDPLTGQERLFTSRRSWADVTPGGTDAAPTT